MQADDDGSRQEAEPEPIGRTRTASGGSVEDRVARLQAAEDASSDDANEDEGVSPEAATKQVRHAQVMSPAVFGSETKLDALKRIISGSLRL